MQTHLASIAIQTKKPTAQLQQQIAHMRPNPARSISAFSTLRVLSAVLLCAVACSMLTGTVLAFFRPDGPAKVSPRTLTYTDRVAYQRAIEEVYWRHRIWPKERPDSKPSFDGVMSRAQLENKVEEYLRNSQVLEDYWQRPLTAKDLQAEMDRMARDTRQPKVLRELFEALGNDPSVIAECLARPVLLKRLITSFAQEPRKVRFASLEVGGNRQMRKVVLANTSYTLPTIYHATTECADTWVPTSTTNAPSARWFHTAVWTGSEMIVWGGDDEDFVPFNTGGRYNPSTDTWTATSIVNAPDARGAHTAIWTGSEMIVWGGDVDNVSLNTGGRYDPSTDTWIPTSTANAPDARVGHTAIWTGSEMIVWGGSLSPNVYSRTGGRYSPNTDSWTAISTINAPSARTQQTAVWTGSEMIVWGGANNFGIYRSGGRYNPDTDTWTETNPYNAPQRRVGHTAVWTGSNMIIWGGTPDAFDLTLRNGGIYNPRNDSWAATNTHHAPDGRYDHTAVWTGREMIVWGGTSLSFPHGYRTFNTGGRYTSSTHSWQTTTTIDAPDARSGHTAVWTGNEMIVWGGYGFGVTLNTGGRYCAGAP